MKTTIDLPDDLYRRVKARSALEGRTVREVTIELYRGWLEGSGPERAQDPVGWVDEWIALGREILPDAAESAPLRTELEGDRGRLDPG